MFKKLAGAAILMVMFAMFILPTQVKACDAPECGKGGLIIPDGVSSFYMWSECGRYVRHITFHYLPEDVEIITIFERYDIAPDIAPSNLEVQPHMGCCLNQNIVAITIIGHETISGPDRTFCIAHRYYDNSLRCLNCRHEQRGGRYTRTGPGCGATF